MAFRVFCLLALLGLLASIVWASLAGDVLTGLRYVAADRWGVVTLIDLAAGLWFVGAWILLREGSLARALPWWLGLALLGNVTTLVYLLYRGLGGRPPATDQQAASNP